MGFARFSTVLTHWQRDLYLYCDHNRSRQQIADRAGDLACVGDEVDAVPAIHARREANGSSDGRLIALAVPTVSPGQRDNRPAAPVLSEEEMQRVKQRLEAWSSDLSSRERAFLGGFLDDVTASTARGK